MPKGKGYALIDYKGKTIIKYTLPKLHYTIVGHSGTEYPTLGSAKQAVDKMTRKQAPQSRKRMYPKRKRR